jgi:hypothetical protein
MADLDYRLIVGNTILTLADRSRSDLEDLVPGWPEACERGITTTGSVETAELADVDESDVGVLRSLEADLAMLLAEEDAEEVGKALEPGSVAAVLVYENSRAGPFAASIRRAGGQLVANGRIPTRALLAAIDRRR